MILYHSPRSCSTAVLIALAESGLDYTVAIADVPSGQTREAGFLALNAWGKVPALALDDGPVLTETVAILSYIAAKAPVGGLLPVAGSVEWARALSFMAMLPSTVHTAFRPLLRPDKLASTQEGQADVRETGVGALNAVLATLDQCIEGKGSVLSSGFSLCDAYAFVFAAWKRRPQITGHAIDTPRLDAVARTVVVRPLASAVLGNIPAI